MMTLWSGGAADKAIIRAGGKIFREVSLSLDQKIGDVGPLGVSIITIEKRKARITSDPSPRQYCISLRQTGEIAICLPNQVSVLRVPLQSFADRGHVPAYATLAGSYLQSNLVEKSLPWLKKGAYARKPHPGCQHSLSTLWLNGERLPQFDNYDHDMLKAKGIELLYHAAQPYYFSNGMYYLPQAQKLLHEIFGFPIPILENMKDKYTPEIAREWLTSLIIEGAQRVSQYNSVTPAISIQSQEDILHVQPELSAPARATQEQECIPQAHPEPEAMPIPPLECLKDIAHYPPTDVLEVLSTARYKKLKKTNLASSNFDEVIQCAQSLINAATQLPRNKKNKLKKREIKEEALQLLEHCVDQHYQPAHAPLMDLYESCKNYSKATSLARESLSFTPTQSTELAHKALDVLERLSSSDPSIFYDLTHYYTYGIENVIPPDFAKAQKYMMHCLKEKSTQEQAIDFFNAYRCKLENGIIELNTESLSFLEAIGKELITLSSTHGKAALCSYFFYRYLRKNMPKDEQIYALSLLNKACQMNEIYAFFEAAAVYKTGDIAEPSQSLALHYLCKAYQAAQSENNEDLIEKAYQAVHAYFKTLKPEAMSHEASVEAQACCTLTGIVFTRDSELALQLFLRAQAILNVFENSNMQKLIDESSLLEALKAQSEHAWAQYALSVYFLNKVLRKSAPCSPKEKIEYLENSLHYCKQALNNGWDYAQTKHLARTHFLLSESVENDVETNKHIQLACQDDYAPALMVWARRCLTGKVDLPSDQLFDNAIDCFVRAAQQGITSAAQELKKMYVSGCLYQPMLQIVLIPRQIQKAREGLARAAQSNPEIDLIYQNALTEKNNSQPDDDFLQAITAYENEEYAKAHELFQKEILKGNHCAHAFEGFMHLHGMGCPQSNDSARESFCRLLTAPSRSGIKAASHYYSMGVKGLLELKNRKDLRAYYNLINYTIEGANKARTPENVDLVIKELEEAEKDALESKDESILAYFIESGVAQKLHSFILRGVSIDQVIRLSSIYLNRIIYQQNNSSSLSLNNVIFLSAPCCALEEALTFQLSYTAGKVHSLTRLSDAEIQVFLQNLRLLNDGLNYKRLLGLFHVCGCVSGLKQCSLKVGLTLLEDVYKGGDSQASYLLAYIYLNAKRITPPDQMIKERVNYDCTSAQKYLNYSAEQNNPAAHRLLAERFYIKGKKRNLTKAIEHLQKALELNDGDAAYELAQLYIDNPQLKNDWTVIEPLLDRAIQESYRYKALALLEKLVYYIDDKREFDVATLIKDCEMMLHHVYLDTRTSIDFFKIAEQKLLTVKLKWLAQKFHSHAHNEATTQQAKHDFIHFHEHTFYLLGTYYSILANLSPEGQEATEVIYQEAQNILEQIPQSCAARILLVKLYISDNITF